VLARWLDRHGRMAEVSRDSLWRGDVVAALDTLCAGPPPAPAALTGVDEAASVLATYLGR